jgi:predicted house-cleaning NTP pyrophosphatase (Maf/HAM1 superfamily)
MAQFELSDDDLDIARQLAAEKRTSVDAVISDSLRMRAAWLESDHVVVLDQEHWDKAQQQLTDDPFDPVIEKYALERPRNFK